ncbi:phosphotransferase, partial [Arthrobacter sp. H20]|uniref:maltokinase N-terminal cap-like domain-containing protein n=1 Tax=Arthrobacter sp. H20 TaxID=1267981 RepID=UPI00056C467A
MPKLTPTFPELLASWLPSQRWFPAKGREFELRRVGGIQLEDPAGQVGLDVHLIAVDSGHRRDIVQIPLSYRAAPLKGADDALIGEAEHSELGHRWIYDATHDPVFVTAWVELMRSGGVTDDGRTTGYPLGSFATAKPFSKPLPLSVLKGEQSNTSVVVRTPAGPMIVKFFRVLAPGESPDVQVSAKLTDAGSIDVPTTFGWVVGSWEDTRANDDQWVTGHLSVLRDFIDNSTDAWRTASVAAASNSDFTAEAAELGRVTGRIHSQLAEAFGSRSASGAEHAEFIETLVQRIEWAWQEARDVVGPLEQEVAKVVEKVRGLTSLPELQRIHADYHLGQVLNAPDKSWLVLDFEGEPLRPAVERSVPDVVLRDVVGMMRSLEYAGAAAAHGNDAATAGADQWTAAAGAAFAAGYQEQTGTQVDPADPLFLALWLDKALYEVVYELRNRPDWVDIPVRDVRRALSGTVASTPRTPSSTSAKTPAAAGPVDAVVAVDSVIAAETVVSSSAVAGTHPVASPQGRIEHPIDVLQSVSEGRYHQPHGVLGAHLDGHELVTIRTLRRLAERVTAVTGSGRTELEHEHNGIWVGTVDTETAGHVPDYRLEVTYDGEPQIVDDPYRFLPTLGEIDMHLLAEGRHETLWTALGAHVRHYTSVLGDINGVSFSVWAPNAQAVRVKADFNGWDGSVNAMRSLGASGFWEIFIPGAEAGSRYKFEILGGDGQWREKADPMARGTEIPPLTGS